MITNKQLFDLTFVAKYHSKWKLVGGTDLETKKKNSRPTQQLTGS